jgi:predicted nucleic acid-binding Zn ribbon protein
MGEDREMKEKVPVTIEKIGVQRDDPDRFSKDVLRRQQAAAAKEGSILDGAGRREYLRAEMRKRLSEPEPPPQPNHGPDVWRLVMADMEERRRTGIEKYNTPLQPFNGRKPLVDAYQECLDMAVYLRQAIEETDRTQGIYAKVFDEVSARVAQGEAVGKALDGVADEVAPRNICRVCLGAAREGKVTCSWKCWLVLAKVEQACGEPCLAPECMMEQMNCELPRDHLGSHQHTCAGSHHGSHAGVVHVGPDDNTKPFVPF